MILSLGFSPCPNDCFMFDAIVNHRIDLEGLAFSVRMADVEALTFYDAIYLELAIRRGLPLASSDAAIAIVPAAMAAASNLFFIGTRQTNSSVPKGILVGRACQSWRVRPAAGRREKS